MCSDASPDSPEQGTPISKWFIRTNMTLNELWHLNEVIVGETRSNRTESLPVILNKVRELAFEVIWSLRSVGFFFLSFFCETIFMFIWIYARGHYRLHFLTSWQRQICFALKYPARELTRIYMYTGSKTNPKHRWAIILSCSMNQVLFIIQLDFLFIKALIVFSHVYLFICILSWLRSHSIKGCQYFSWPFLWQIFWY